MPISRCQRCDQLIEFDALHEGEEVLCPACDNITRLRAVLEDDPSDATNGGDGDSLPARGPIRLPALDLPPPAVDPVAASGAPDDAEDVRDSASPPSAAGKQAEPERLSDVEKAELAAIRILAPGEVDEDEDEDFRLASTDGDTIRLRLPLDRPWLLGGIAVALVAVVVFAAKLVHDKVEESRPLTEDEVRAILASQPRVGVPDPEPPPPRSLGVVPPPSPAEPEPPRGMVGEPASKVVKDAVDVRFPTLPGELARDGQRAASEAFRFYTEMAFKEPFRLFGDTVIDLRTLRFAANAGMIDFPDGWSLLGGLVQGRNADGLQLRLDRRFHAGGGVVLVPDFPEVFRVERDQPVGLMLRKKGSRRVAVTDGEEQVVQTYEFGLLPSEPMVRIAEIKAAEREAIARREMEALAKRQADEAAMEAAKKKQGLDARTIRFLQSRVKKGFASAQYRLGLRYLEGEGVPRNRDEGLRLIRAAAAQDYREALSRLEEMGLN